MKSSVIISNIFSLFVVAIVIETAVSAFFSITAVKEHERKVLMKSMREAITFLAAFFFCFVVPEIRIFKESGIKITGMADTIISALLIARMSDIVSGLISKLKGE